LTHQQQADRDQKRADYEAFLRSKMVTAPERGIAIDAGAVNPKLKPFTRDIVSWALRGGRRAIFAAFGLHKTATQIEIMRLLESPAKGLRLIVLPLGVRQEFFRDSRTLFQGDYAVTLKFIRTVGEVDDERTVYLTNYESVRDGILDVSGVAAVSLDEAAILAARGSKTFGEFTFKFFQNTNYKFVATATPDPNEHQELLSYAAFLRICDISQARTRFFRRNSEHADRLTLHPHKKREFWLWVSSWAVFLQRPSDLGYSDDGYDLPGLDVYWHELPTDHLSASPNKKTGQGRLLRNTAHGVPDAAREKRESMPARIAKLLELRTIDPSAHRLIWHDLEAERKAIENAIPGITTVYGNQDLESREQSIIDFSDGKIQELAGKPSMLGSGTNFQRFCSWAIFAGIGFKFREFFQSIHRIQRFQQSNRVRIDMIYTEAERSVRANLEGKWKQHKEQMAEMSGIIREFGLAANATTRQELTRAIGVERQELAGEMFALVNNDSVLETAQMPAESVHLIVTSIPFASQYEYSPSYNDFGHTESNAHFFEQMDFLTPELLRVLKPGRVVALHVKDRVVDGAMTGLGFQTVYYFHADVIKHFEKHGFKSLGMKTIVTDVVRENNQTYRLGWTEQCKDGSRMGAGLPEYLLLFRKPQTDRSRGYADEPVLKEKEEYTRAKWQIDAHGFMRSNGNRLLSVDELKGQKWGVIFRAFRAHSLTQIYDFDEHVKLGEALDEAGRLPVDFMLLPPQSWHPDVWTDVTRMRSLNSAQSSAGREKHLCPLPIDIADRAIMQFSQKGETVYDPFGGLGTVALRAIKLGRKGIACELSPSYFKDACFYCEAAERQMATPSLFDLLVEPEAEEVSA
jgi:DNA modification methylase